MRLEVVRETAASSDAVWSVLTEWERQPDWMVDAKAVHVRTPYRTGVGVTIQCPTNLVGFTVQDIMRVTTWRPPFELEVIHLGRVIRGSGVFLIEPQDDGGTRVRWIEQIEAPFGILGKVGARALLPILRAVFGRSLDRLLALVPAG